MSTKGTPVKVAFVSDTSDLRRAISQAEESMEDMERTAKSAGEKVEEALGSTAEAADSTASAASQLAGGIGDLAGALEAQGLISESTAEAFGVLEASIMGVTGVSDLVNLATEKMPGLQKLATATTNGLAVAKRALGAAIRFALGPVGLIIAAVTLLTAGVVYLWKNNETFREVVTAVWAGVKSAVGATVDWFRDHVPPIFEKVWAVIKNIPVVWVIRNFDKLVDYAKALPGRMWAAVSGMWDGIKDGFRGVINWVIDRWNGFSISLPGVKVPGLGQVGGFTLNTPDIPRLNSGGIVTRDTVVRVGEQRPEAIVPLDRLAGLGMGGITVNVYADATTDRVALGRELVNVIGVYLRSGGRFPAGALG